VVLGLSWEALEALCDALGVVLGPLGVLWDYSWILLGPLGLLLEHLGCSWGALGTSRCPLGPLLEALDLVARTLGVLKGHASCKISARKNKKRAPGDPWGRKQKNEKPHAEQTAKYITHKGSNAFPEKAATAEHH
jgi:hypothetical protein